MAADAQPAGPFLVTAVNVNGLSAVMKRRNFFAWLQQQRCGVVLLSETHSTSDSQALTWVQEGAGPGRPWQGAARWSRQVVRGQRAAGGVGVLVADNLIKAGAEIEVEYSSASGRALKVAWETPWGQRLAAVAVYAPCTAAHRDDFFVGEYLDAVTAGTQQYQIVGGDFNCVMRPEDVLVPPQRSAEDSGRLQGGVSLHTANLLAGLQDAWLACNPCRKQPTHYTQHGSRSGSGEGQGELSGGRLDYIFLSEGLMDEGWLKSAQQHRRFPSDHRPVMVQLQPRGSPQPGPRRWRFPNHMLGVQQFIDSLKQQLEEAVSELAQRSPRLDPAAEWEEIKDSAISISKRLQQQLQREQNTERRQLRQQVAAARRIAERFPSSRAERDLLTAEQDLTDFETAVLQRSVAATEPLWEVYGESSTYWFHRLGKAATEPQFIAEVLAPDGTTVRAQGRAGVAAAGGLLADFYDPATGGLFAQRPTDEQQQQEMLAAIDKQLDEEGHQQCQGAQADGSISTAEAHDALRSLPRGKSPGSDGLTYEFYTAMWEVVGDPLVAAFNHCFSQDLPMLSERQRLGLIVLIFKGGGKLRADAASYRPITLLNCDVKIIAKVMVRRFGPAMDSVIDSTQTAFVPGRDIADNVLLHLEEIDYLQESAEQQGCIVFLDFEKAYDRLDRGWLFQCMEAMQFPDSSMRWVRLLLGGTRGQVVFNGGHHSRVFDIPSGCAQGSPLSPLLYVIAAQPLAAKCRQLQRDGRITSISMPDGSDAPSCHQHADDTTLHAATVAGIRVLLRSAVEPFCAASGAKLNNSKCQGMTLGSHPQLVGADADTGVRFVDTTAQPIRHLGVPLSTRGAAAFADQLFTQRLSSITYKARTWSKHKLTLLGRCEVARQVMASSLVYHAQFVPVPAPVMQLIQRRIKAFTLGLGCIPSSENRQLVCRPSSAVANLPIQRGGIGHVDVQAHVTAMQAKVAVALLHPHRHPWKQFMRANLEKQAPGLGVMVLLQQSVSSRPNGLTGRHQAYVEAFQQLGLCRQVPHEAMSAHQVKVELLVGNHSVADATTGLAMRSPTCLPAQLQPRTASTTLGQVSAAFSWQPAIDGIIIPPSWQQALQQQVSNAAAGWWVDSQQRWVRQIGGGEGPAIWYEVLHDGSLSLLEDTTAVQRSTVSLPACVVYTTWGGPRKQPQPQQGAAEGPAAARVPYLVGAWQDVTADPSVWSFGPGLGLLEYTVKAATQRLLQFACSGTRGWVPGLGIRPRVWRDKRGNLDTAGLEQLEGSQKRSFERMLSGGFRRQVKFAAADVAAGMDAYWMHPSPPRQHPRQRAAAQQATAAAGRLTSVREQQERLQLHAPAIDDTEDPLTRDMGPATQEDQLWVAAYRRVNAKHLPRHLRVLGWQVLHAAVRVGGSSHFAARNMEQLLQCCCPQPECRPREQQQASQQQNQSQPLQLAASQQQHQQQPGSQQQHQQRASPSQLSASQLSTSQLSASQLSASQLSDSQQQQPQRHISASQEQQQEQGQASQQQQHQRRRSARQQQQRQGQPAQQQPAHGCLATLTHVLCHCAPVILAWNWFARVWDQIEPGSVSERNLDETDPRVMLLDDSRVWQTPAALIPLWTHLRLLMLQSILDVKDNSNGQPCSSSQIISRFVAALQQQIRQDWGRVRDDIRLDAGVPLSWLRGRSPCMAPERFTAKWQPAGVLYTLGEDGKPRVCLPPYAASADDAV